MDTDTTPDMARKEKEIRRKRDERHEEKWKKKKSVSAALTPIPFSLLPLFPLLCSSIFVL
jgi:hypothetical protein